MELEVGAILEGKVTGITKFGAFVALPDGRSGLVHISEVANTYVNDVSEHLSEGQTVNVCVIGIDQNKRINLSIKKALPQTRPYAGVSVSAGSSTFEDKLKQFMQDSDNRMSDLSRNVDRRGRSRSRRA